MSSEWATTTIGEQATLQRGFDITKAAQEEGEIPVISSGGTNSYHSTAMVKGPGVVLGRKGVVGSVYFVQEEFWPHDTTLWVKDFHGNDELFTYYFFLSRAKDLAALDVGSANPTLNRNHVHPIKIRWPSLSEQRLIGKFLRAFDDRITLLRETNATLEAIAQALFKSWFVDFDPVHAKQQGRAPEGMDEATAALFPDSFEESELRLVPKGWQVMPFLAACDLQGGAQPPASTFKDEPLEGYVRLLQIRDFSADTHKTYIPDTQKLKKVSEDDVLIGRYGSASGDKAKDSLGRVCRGLSGAYNVALMRLNPLLIGGEFALQMVNDPRFYGYLQGVSSKAVQSGFSKNELGQYKVVIPPREVADVYETFGSMIWTRVKANAEMRCQLTELRDALLPRLISGQLRLPEAEALLTESMP